MHKHVYEVPQRGSADDELILSAAPDPPESLVLILDRPVADERGIVAILLTPGHDYELTGNRIELSGPPMPGDTVRASYEVGIS